MSTSERPPDMVWISSARTGGSGQVIHQDEDCSHLSKAETKIEKDRNLYWDGYFDWCQYCSEEYR